MHESTVRDACELGYQVTVIRDCGTTVTPELQQASITLVRYRYACILNTSEAITENE